MIRIRLISAALGILLFLPLPTVHAALIAEYTFDGNANDSSGNGFNGILGGDAGFGAGMFGQALQLDGNGDYVAVDMPTQTLSSFTIETWFNSSTASPSDAHLVSLNDANNFLVLWDLTSSSISGWATGLSSVNLTGLLGGSLQANRWYHSAFTYDGAQTKMYIDGILIASTSVTGSLGPIGGANKLGIGARYNLSSQFFEGALDNVRIYDSALSESELGYYTDVATIPEPTTLALMGLGLAGIGYKRHRSKLAA